MSENDDTTPTAPIVPDVRHADTPESGAEGQGPSPRPGWRERAYGIRSVAAVAVAGLIIGGGAGAAIHAATADDGGRDGRPGFGGNGGPGGGGFRGPGQMPGQGQLPGQGQGPGQRQLPGQGQLPQPPGAIPAPRDGAPQQPTTPPSDGVAPDGSGATTSGDAT